MFGWDSASLSFLLPPYTCPIMRTSSSPNRSFGLRLGGRPTKESELRQTGGGSSSLIAVVDKAPPADHPSLSGKARERLVRLGTLVVPNI